MDADLDSLLTVVFCTADDLLPTKPGNATRMVTDAEVVTLAAAQVLLGYHNSDRRFLAAAERRLKASVPGDPDPGRVSQASCEAGGEHRVADRRVRRPESSPMRPTAR